MTTRLDVATLNRTGRRAARLLAMATALWAGVAQAQATASGHVALQGTYIEVGVNRDGFFGLPTSELPAGYHAAHSPGALGFVADYRKDGWTGQYGGDYFTPGTPFEGFYLKWNGSTGVGNAGGMGSSIPSLGLVDTSAGDTHSAVWTGEVAAGGDQLKIIQTYSFKSGDLFFTANVQIINTGATTVDTLRFARVVDPDNDVTWPGGGYSTHNQVLYQPGAASTKALVTGTGRGVTDMTLGLGAFDARASVNADTHWDLDPDTAFAGITTDVVGDTTIALGFELGSLAPGQSVSFDYAYILSANDLDAALGALAAISILQPTGTVSGHDVPFSVATNDLAHTTQVDFWVGGTLIGSSAAPVGGAFTTSFDSTTYPNGALALKVVATINGAPVEKSSTVLVDNSGPPLEFASPANGAAVGGSAVPVLLTTDPLNTPTSVTFYREVAGQPAVALGTVTGAPFMTTVDVSDLVPGTAVTIRAVGTNLSGKSTNVTVGVLVASGPSDVQPVGGGTQSAGPGGTSGPICVRLLDGGGQPMAGQAVTFTAPASGASATLVSPVTTGADGLACTTATANTVAGTYAVTASAGSFTMTAATLTNLPGPAARAVVAADRATQSVVVGHAFLDLALTVKDQYGNPVPGVLVDYAHQAGDQAGFLAILSTHTGLSDAAGQVAVAAVANHVVGAEVLDVTLDGLRVSGVFHLAGTPDAVATLRADWVSSPQTAPAGDVAFANPLGVTAQDQWGNAVPGATVLFTAPRSGASCRLSAFTAATDAAGHAAVSAASREVAGAYAVTATVDAVTTTFSLANAPAAPGAIELPTASASGSGQRAPVDGAFAAPLTVTVVDAYGNPVPGAAVAFAAPASGPSAALSATALVTDAHGQATVRATANTVAGAYRVTAAADGVAAPVAFDLVNAPGAPAALTAAPATATQSAQVATGFAARLAATVTDSHGNAVPGVPVRFAAPATGATAALQAGLATSDAAGQVSVEAVAGTVTGSYQVTATATGVAAPTAFALANLPGAAGSLTVSAGSPQTAVVGAAFAAGLQVQVRDRFGNAVPGVAVAFSAPATRATAALSAASATTGADGRCGVTATAGTVAGAYQIVASAPGVALPVQLGLANLAGPAAAIAPLAGASGQTTRVGDPFAAPLTVAVTDAHGNPVSGAAVAFACPASTACALDAASATSDADGRAGVKATAGGTPSAFDATATLAGLAPAAFHLVSQVGLPGTVESTAGASQEATVFAAFGSPLAVLVKDRFGNPVPGAAVAFEVVSTGLQSASLSGFSAITDAAGAASITATANRAQGRYAVRASAAGAAAPVAFDLVNQPLPTTTAARAALAVAATVTGQADTVHVRVDVTAAGGPVPTGQVRLGSTAALRPLPGQAGVSWSGSDLTVTLAAGTAGVDLEITDWRSQTLTATYLPDVTSAPTFAGSTVTVPLRASVEESVSGGCGSGGSGSLAGLLLVGLALSALRRRPARARQPARSVGRKLLVSSLLGLLLAAPMAARAEAPAPLPGRVILGLRLGYAAAAGDAVKDSPMSEGARAAVPIQLEIGYRFLGRLTVGAYGSWGPAAVGRFCAGASCSGSQIRYGAQASWRFDPTAGVIPWAGLGLGWEQTDLKATSAGDTLKLTRGGLELLDLQAGGDVALGRFTVGPFLQVALGRYVRQDVKSPLGDSSGGVSHPSNHSWLQLGVRGTVAL